MLPMGIIVGMIFIMGQSQDFFHKAAFGKVLFSLEIIVGVVNLILILSIYIVFLAELKFLSIHV